jgi:hypothetical protein
VFFHDDRGCFRQSSEKRGSTFTLASGVERACEPLVRAHACARARARYSFELLFRGLVNRTGQFRTISRLEARRATSAAKMIPKASPRLECRSRGQLAARKWHPERRPCQAFHAAKSPSTVFQSLSSRKSSRKNLWLGAPSLDGVPGRIPPPRLLFLRGRLSQIPCLGDYTVQNPADTHMNLRWVMNYFVIQDSNFRGQVSQALKSDPPFYTYSLWRDPSGEHLFDGAAGDLAEAVATLRAHIAHLRSVPTVLETGAA